jgi:hypothetical protein
VGRWQKAWFLPAALGSGHYSVGRWQKAWFLPAALGMKI